MNGIVSREQDGWPQAHIISLKFLTIDGNRLFNRAGSAIKDDDRFYFKTLPPESIRDVTDSRVLDMLESSIVDSVLHLPILDNPSNLWSLGWDGKFTWGSALPPRCGFDFMELWANVVYSIIDSSTGNYRSFHHSWVRKDPLKNLST